MEKFTTVTGIAAPMSFINIDTDMIIPKNYLRTIKRSGLGKGLFAEMRYLSDQSENTDFILNQPNYRRACFLIVGENFGCGSSREHAAWALKDFGIKAIFSTSFADIFYNNAFKNGLLPLTLPKKQWQKILEDSSLGANATFTIDLEKQHIICPSGSQITFEIDSFRRHCLLNGLDDIGLTLEKEQNIQEFEQKLAVQLPWV